jgi:hypothetical protein
MFLSEVVANILPFDSMVSTISNDEIRVDLAQSTSE